MHYVVVLLFSSVVIGIVIVLPLAFGIVFTWRGKGWVRWLGRALLYWSFILIGFILFNQLRRLGVFSG